MREDPDWVTVAGEKHVPRNDFTYFLSLLYKLMITKVSSPTLPYEDKQIPHFSQFYVVLSLE